MIFVSVAILHTVMRTLATGGWSQEQRTGQQGIEADGKHLWELSLCKH